MQIISSEINIYFISAYHEVKVCPFALVYFLIDLELFFLTSSTLYVTLCYLLVHMLDISF